MAPSQRTIHYNHQLNNNVENVHHRRDNHVVFHRFGRKVYREYGSEAKPRNIANTLHLKYDMHFNLKDLKISNTEVVSAKSGESVSGAQNVVRL